MQQVLETARIVGSAIYVLFLPGFTLSFAIFRRGAIDIIERLALSFALSIAVIPLFVFYLNLLGVRLGLLSVMAEAFFVTLVGMLVALLRGNLRKGNEIEKSSQ